MEGSPQGCLLDLAEGLPYRSTMTRSRRQLRRALNLGVVVASFGCAKQDTAGSSGSSSGPPSVVSSAPRGASTAKPPAAPSATAPTPLDQPIQVTLHGKPTTLTSGATTWLNGALVVGLSDAPVDCAHAFTGSKVSIRVPSGPEQRFFVGTEIPAQVNLPDFYDLGTVKMTRVGSKAGDLAEGSFRYEKVDAKGVATSASGDFRVRLCQDAPALPALPTAAKTQDVGGTLARKPWVARSAIAFALDAGHGRYVERVLFYPEPDPSCAWLRQERESLDVTVAEAKEDAAGQIRPVEVFHHEASPDGGHKPTMTIGNIGWIRFANVSFAKGTTIRGELVLDEPRKASWGYPGDHVEGTFAALLCP
jgi:hypothetical protein